MFAKYNWGLSVLGTRYSVLGTQGHDLSIGEFFDHYGNFTITECQRQVGRKARATRLLYTIAVKDYTLDADNGLSEPPANSVNQTPAQAGSGKRAGGYMSARIRLKKFGTKKRPYYRIVVMDKQSPRDGKTIEELGYYHPIEAEDKQIVFDAEKAKAWLAKGATVTDTVRRIFNKKNVAIK